MNTDGCNHQKTSMTAMPKDTASSPQATTNNRTSTLGITAANADAVASGSTSTIPAVD